MTVTKVLRCQSTSSTLTNCTATGQREVKDYFYRKEDGVRGEVGVLMESDTVEEPCTRDKETDDDWAPDDSWTQGWEDWPVNLDISLVSWFAF